jgi:hypothetical protein
MAMFAAAWLSRRLHPRLGLPKRKAATLPAPTMATGR